MLPHPSDIHPPFTRPDDPGVMSMAEPLLPHADEPDTALDEHEDAPVPEEHGEPAEANETPTSADRAAQADVLPAFPPSED